MRAFFLEVFVRLLSRILINPCWDVGDAIYAGVFRRALRTICCLLPLAPFGIWKIADLICNLLAR